MVALALLTALLVSCSGVNSVAGPQAKESMSPNPVKDADTRSK
jgi:hypothetical protein